MSSVQARGRGGEEKAAAGEIEEMSERQMDRGEMGQAGAGGLQGECCLAGCINRFQA